MNLSTYLVLLGGCAPADSDELSSSKAYDGSEGAEVWIADRGSSTISVMSTETDEVVATIPFDGEPMYINASRTNSHVFIGDREHSRIRVFDSEKRELV